MQAALSAFEHWSQTSVEERASLLFHVADLLRERKFEFAACMVFEVSKNWAEADADVAETIDFLEYYGREALRLAKVKPEPVSYTHLAKYSDIQLNQKIPDSEFKLKTTGKTKFVSPQG